MEALAGLGRPPDHDTLAVKEDKRPRRSLLHVPAIFLLKFHGAKGRPGNPLIIAKDDRRLVPQRAQRYDAVLLRIRRPTPECGLCLLPGCDADETLVNASVFTSLPEILWGLGTPSSRDKLGVLFVTFLMCKRRRQHVEIGELLADKEIHMAHRLPITQLQLRAAAELDSASVARRRPSSPKI